MMSLWTMLPFYLMGNFHCIGMCGPLVAMIGKHRYRLYYFLGRLIAFTLAGGLAGGSGAVLGALLQPYHLSALTSFVFGGLLLIYSIQALFPASLPAVYLQSVKLVPTRIMTPLNQTITPLMLQDRRFPTFLFGFLTIALPCGQTIIVYSACALLADGLLGCLHGLFFALLTSPSLFLAMQFHRLMPRIRALAERGTALFALSVALFALARGCAELGWISHLSLSQKYHLMLY